MRRRSSGSPALIGGRRPLVLVLAVVVAALLVEREEAVELHDLAGGAQIEVARADASAAMSTVVRSSSADSIWLATVRIQISS